MTVKRCSRCYFRKPTVYFHPRERRPDGTVRTYQSRCKACAREFARETNARQRNRDRPYDGRKPSMTREQALARRREQYAARMARIAADPEKLAEWRESVRLKEKLRRERHGAKSYPPRRKWRDGRKVAGSWCPPSALETVDPAPFIAYLDRAFVGWTREELARVIGVPSRRLRDWGDQGMRAELDAIDRALTKGLGRPDLLNALYPVKVGA